MLLGELGLDGRLYSVAGALPAVLEAQRRGFRIGLRVQLAVHHLTVQPSASQGSRPIARRHERTHVAGDVAGAQRIEIGEALPPPDRVDRRSVLIRDLGEALQSPAHLQFEGAALPLDPPLELRRPREVESVEKLAGVEPDLEPGSLPPRLVRYFADALARRP